MATEPLTEAELAFDNAAVLAAREREHVPGASPSKLALRRLRRNRTALAFGVLFVVIVVLCLAAPYWADHIAKTDPYKNHLTDTVRVGGETKDVVSPDGVPIGPTWSGRYFLGADSNGRDIAVRLLYGGRTSLIIGVAASLMTLILAVVFGTLAGFFGRWIDWVISRALDIIWPFPPLLLGVALGTALALGGLKIGPLEVDGDSKLIPVLIIGVIYVPYMARPIRGQVLSLREKEFVEAARAQGAGPMRIMLTEILPNLASTIIVFFPLLIANAILLEASLSFLGAGVQPPEPSWGSMIGDGVDTIITGPHLAIVPGAMLVATVLALNVFGDGVRDAFDPRAKVRIEH